MTTFDVNVIAAMGKPLTGLETRSPIIDKRGRFLRCNLPGQQAYALDSSAHEARDEDSIQRIVPKPTDYPKTTS